MTSFYQRDANFDCGFQPLNFPLPLRTRFLCNMVLLDLEPHECSRQMAPCFSSGFCKVDRRLWQTDRQNTLRLMSLG